MKKVTVSASNEENAVLSGSVPSVHPTPNEDSVLRYPFRQMNMHWWGSFVKASTNDPSAPLRITFCLIAHAIVLEDPYMENAVTYIMARYPLSLNTEEGYLYELYKTICRVADYPSLSEASRCPFIEEESDRVQQLGRNLMQFHDKKRAETIISPAMSDVFLGFRALIQEMDPKVGFSQLMTSLKKLYLVTAHPCGVDLPDAPLDTFVCCDGCPCYARLRSMHTIFLRDVEKAKVIDCIMIAGVKENDSTMRDAASELLYNHFYDVMENPFMDDMSYFIHNGNLFFCRAALFDALSLIDYFTQAPESIRDRKEDVNRIVIPLLWVKNEIRETRGLNELVIFLDKALATAESSYMELGRCDYLQAFHTIKEHIFVVFCALSAPRYLLAVHSKDLFSGKSLDMKCANPECDGTTRDLLKCSGCDMTYYCSSQCQKKNWISHRAFCHDIESRRAHPVPVEAMFGPVMRIKSVI